MASFQLSSFQSASLTYDTAAALLDSQQPPMVRCDSFVRSHDLIFVRDASLDKRPSPELILDLYKRVQHLDLMQYVRKFLEEKQLQDVKKEDLKRVLRVRLLMTNCVLKRVPLSIIFKRVHVLFISFKSSPWSDNYQFNDTGKR